MKKRRSRPCLPKITQADEEILDRLQRQVRFMAKRRQKCCARSIHTGVIWAVIILPLSNASESNDGTILQTLGQRSREMGPAVFGARAYGGAYGRGGRNSFRLQHGRGHAHRTAGAVQPSPPCSRAGPRLPLLPYKRGKIFLRRATRYPHLHGLP
jgi:hypothetical protein